MVFNCLVIEQLNYKRNNKIVGHKNALQGIERKSSYRAQWGILIQLSSFERIPIND